VDLSGIRETFNSTLPVDLSGVLEQRSWLDESPYDRVEEQAVQEMAVGESTNV